MGRTLPTVIDLIKMQEDEWKPFCRTLRKEDQKAFDLLWRIARYHAPAISMASSPIPIERMYMAMLVGLASQIMELQKVCGKEEPDGEIRGMDI